MMEVVKTSKAPEAIGPYSQAIKASGFVFCSGQIPIDPTTKQVDGKYIKTQTQQAIKNLEAILKESGSSLKKVVKTTVFLKNLNDFNGMNDVYAGFFKEKPPARATVQVSRLPKDVLIEIEAIAVIE